MGYASGSMTLRSKIRWYQARYRIKVEVTEKEDSYDVSVIRGKDTITTMVPKPIEGVDEMVIEQIHAFIKERIPSAND